MVARLGHRVGAQFVADVVPFEMMKLACLTAGHLSSPIWVISAGMTLIADTMTNPALPARGAGADVDEQAPTLSMPEGTDLKRGYAYSADARFTNPR